MSKPLELTVYPTWTNGLDGTIYCSAFQHEGYPRPVDIDRLAKRFTEAELCAEFEAARCDWIMSDVTGDYWSPLGDTWSHDAQAVSDRVMTLLRFANSPHYDELNP